MTSILKQTFDKNPHLQLESIMNEIKNCTKCMHENICRNHTELVKTILMNEAQHRVNGLEL
jgi:hypothetical protein